MRFMATLSSCRARALRLYAQWHPWRPSISSRQHIISRLLPGTCVSCAPPRTGWRPDISLSGSPCFLLRRHCQRRTYRHRPCLRLRAAEGDDAESAGPVRGKSQLELVIRRKQTQVEAQLTELGVEALEQRLQDSVQVPASPPYKLARLIANAAPQVLVCRHATPGPALLPWCSHKTPHSVDIST